MRSIRGYSLTFTYRSYYPSSIWPFAFVSFLPASHYDQPSSHTWTRRERHAVCLPVIYTCRPPLVLNGSIRSTTESAVQIFIGPRYKLFRVSSRQALEKSRVHNYPQRVVNGLFALSLAAEASVTVSMTYYLYRSKSAYARYVPVCWSPWLDRWTLFSNRTNSIVAVLMKYTLSTG